MNKIQKGKKKQKIKFQKKRRKRKGNKRIKKFKKFFNFQVSSKQREKFCPPQDTNITVTQEHLEKVKGTDSKKTK